jgi:hypothetical protein
MVRNDLADLIPESVASKALRMKPESHSSDESEIVPSLPATEILQEKAKKIVAVKVDPESPNLYAEAKAPPLG